jgi:hypothetical protein
MHFELNQFLDTDALEERTGTRYVATKQHVFNRGVPPDDFLDQLVAWGKQASDEIFEKNNVSDIYSSVKNTLGPWRDLPHRRAAMLEVMRVLAGFESSWDWKEGRDNTNPASVNAGNYRSGGLAGKRRLHEFWTRAKRSGS